MPRKTIFANNIRSLLAYKNLTRREAARQWGMKYDVLNRWSSAGIEHAHPTTAVQLRQLAIAFDFTEIDQLWTEWVSPLDRPETPPAPEVPDTPQMVLERLEDQLDLLSDVDYQAAMTLIHEHCIAERNPLAPPLTPQVQVAAPQVQPVIPPTSLADRLQKIKQKKRERAEQAARTKIAYDWLDLESESAPQVQPKIDPQDSPITREYTDEIENDEIEELNFLEEMRHYGGKPDV